MTELPTIQEALAAVKKAVGGVSKSERNQQQGFNFRGIDAVLNAVSPALTAHGIITIPQLLDYTYETVEIGRNKTSMGHVVVKVKYVFLGPKGDFIETQVAAESMDSGDKAMTKAMSVAFRIALIQTLALPTDEADPDHDIYERSAKEEAPKGSAASTARTSTRTSASPPRTASSSAPQSADPVLPNPDLPGIVKAIAAAKTADELNKVWKQAGELGVLTTKHEGKTIQQLMYDRGDAIKREKGN